MNSRASVALTAAEFARATQPRLLDRLSEFSEFHVLYHADVDGVCAAASIVKLLREREGARVSASWVPTSEFHFSNFIAKHPKKDELCYISLDINFSSRRGLIADLGRAYGRGFILIDDHLLNEDPGDDGLLILNPNFGVDTPVDLASSLYGYLVATEAGCRIPDWVPILGLYFDRQLGAYAELLTVHPQSSEMDEIIRIGSAQYLDDGRDHASDLMLTLLGGAIDSQSAWSSFAMQVRSNGELVSLYQANEQEIGRVWAQVERDKRQIGRHKGHRVEGVEFRSRLQIANIVASRMRGSRQEGLYVSLRRNEAFSQFELRMGQAVSDVNFVDLLQRFNDAFPLANFGGHPRAAGGAIRTGDAARFWQIFGEIL